MKITHLDHLLDMVAKFKYDMEHQLEMKKTQHQNVESMTRTFCDYVFPLIIESYKTCILSHPKKPKF
jgi:hypothetical protein